MNNKIIILSVLLFTFVSFIFLSIVERKQADINNQNIWMVYFSDPKSSSLDFQIENHSSNPAFHWQVMIDKAVINEGDTSVNTGEIKKIPISMDSTENKKIIISVTDNKNGKKEIYKSLP